ncbi:serine protease inhibitor Kazal-type 1-like [Gracilinanus agilis]|uniref:serine protease inhibitor Kazal-type 1-like n=1 Tax=Gracilinanus agilis TaxID=191870 RepID=UPI001CFD426B|nr:serine protease inhibitor Kazal-type 1-like [Gracilinanus agilis]
MRTLSIFLLLSVALCCFLDTVQAEKFPREPECNYNFPGCPQLYSPICGTDGHTYSNECELCRDNKKNSVHVLIEKEDECFRS